MKFLSSGARQRGMKRHVVDITLLGDNWEVGTGRYNRGGIVGDHKLMVGAAPFTVFFCSDKNGKWNI